MQKIKYESVDGIVEEEVFSVNKINNGILVVKKEEDKTNIFIPYQRIFEVIEDIQDNRPYCV